MKNRLEYKYLAPVQYIDRLRNDLLRYLEYDDYAAVRPNKEYTVRSVYLDSYDYKCYYEKLDGIHTRNKFRIRGYNNQGDGSKLFFEIKRKYDNFISKDRVGIPLPDLYKAFSASHTELYLDDEEQKYFNNFYYYYQLRRLEPKVLVVYDREPFQCKFGSQLRITMDKNLRSKVVSGYEELFEEEGLVRSFKKEFIFEVKFFQVLPQWISPVLGKYDLTRIAVSKYTSSIDAQQISSISSNRLTRSDFQNRKT
jgi:SPX domain protein involved in polyphosphate accumulation